MPGRFRFNRVRRAIREAAAPAPPQPPNWYQEAPVNPGVLPPWQPRGWQQFDPAAVQVPRQEAQNQAPEPVGVGLDVHRRLAALQVELEHQHQAMLQGMKKQKLAKLPTRAIPAGRMRSVRFGDILRAYRRTTALHRDHYAMIDFRVPKVGDYYMDTTFTIHKVEEDDMVKMPLIIIELVKGKKQLEVEDVGGYLNEDIIEPRRR